MLHVHTTFKMPTIRQVQQHIQQGDCAFSIDLKDAYLLGQTKPISGSFCYFG